MFERFQYFTWHYHRVWKCCDCYPGYFSICMFIRECSLENIKKKQHIMIVTELSLIWHTVKLYEIRRGRSCCEKTFKYFEKKKRNIWSSAFYWCSNNYLWHNRNKNRGLIKIFKILLNNTSRAKFKNNCKFLTLRWLLNWWLVYYK